MFNYDSVINSHTGKPYDKGNADRFCTMYNFMVKHCKNITDEKIGGEPSPIHDPNMTHLEYAIGVALRSLATFGCPDADFIGKVYKEIHNIKTLYENQPTYKIVLSHDYKDTEGETITSNREILLKTYCDQNSVQFIGLINKKRYENITSIKLSTNG
jgi:hypothetical protein